MRLPFCKRRCQQIQKTDHPQIQHRLALQKERRKRSGLGRFGSLKKTYFFWSLPNLDWLKRYCDFASLQNSLSKILQDQIPSCVHEEFHLLLRGCFAEFRCDDSVASLCFDIENGRAVVRMGKIELELAPISTSIRRTYSQNSVIIFVFVPFEFGFLIWLPLEWIVRFDVLWGKMLGLGPRILSSSSSSSLCLFCGENESESFVSPCTLKKIPRVLHLQLYSLLLGFVRCLESVWVDIFDHQSDVTASLSKVGEKCCVSEELRYLTKWWLTNEFTHMSPLCRRIKLTDWAFGDTMVLDEEVKDRVSYPYWKSRISFCPWISKPEMKARTFSRAYLVKKCKTFREKSCLVLLQSKYSLASFKGKHDER